MMNARKRASSRRIASLSEGLLGLALMGLLAACSSVEATSTPFVGASHPPPTNPAQVQILRSEPTRPNDQLGDVVIDASVEPAPPVTEIETKMRDEAAKMGADAVVVVRDDTEPVAAYVTGPLWDRDIQTISGRKVVGVAIAYRR